MPKPHKQPPNLERRTTASPPSHILVPVTRIAWLSGDLGAYFQKTLLGYLQGVPSVGITRLPRSLAIQANEEPGILLERVHRAVLDLESAVAVAYPVFHHELGPLWTGILHAVFPDAAQRSP